METFYLVLDQQGLILSRVIAMDDEMALYLAKNKYPSLMGLQVRPLPPRTGGRGTPAVPGSR